MATYRTAEGSDFDPEQIEMTITAPRGFRIGEIVRDPDLEDWLDHPIRPGDVPGSYEYRIRGRLSHHAPGFRIKLDIYTDRWWPQFDRVQLAADGSFEGPVWIDKSRPPMVFKFSLTDLTGVTIRIFDVLF